MATSDFVQPYYKCTEKEEFFKLKKILA